MSSNDKEHLLKIGLKSRSPEDRKRIARMGAEASALKRKQARETREMLETLLSTRLKDRVSIKQLKQLGLEKQDANNMGVLIATLFQRALSGDMKAMELTLQLRESGKHNTGKSNENINSVLEGLKSRSVDGLDNE